MTAKPKATVSKKLYEVTVKIGQTIKARSEDKAYELFHDWLGNYWINGPTEVRDVAKNGITRGNGSTRSTQWMGQGLATSSPKPKRTAHNPRILLSNATQSCGTENEAAFVL